MNRLVLSANWQGHQFMLYWRSTWRQLTVNVDDQQQKMNTWFVKKSKPMLLRVEELTIQVEFKKLIKEKVAIIVLKVEGVILKVQAIALQTGAKLSMSSIGYEQLPK